MESHIINLQQGSEEWKNYRRTKITATDTGIIMGLNPYKTRLQLWEEKLGLREPQAVNDKMREGSLLEDQARILVNKIMETDYKPAVLLSMENPFMMASLDGMNSKNEILEIKCGKGSHELALKKEIPSYYMAQLQKQMYVANALSCYYFSYRNDEDNIGFDVYRNDALIDRIIKAETEFYRMMMDFTPPPATDKDFIHRDSKEWRLHAEIYKDTKKQLSLLVQKEELLREELIKMCDGQSSQGSGIRISKTTSKGRINYNAIDELKEIDLEKYRGKNITSYRFTEVKGENE